MFHFEIRLATQKDIAKLLEFEQGVVDAERPFNQLIKNENAHYYNLAALIADQNASLQIAEIDTLTVGCGYVQLRKSKDALVHDVHA